MKTPRTLLRELLHLPVKTYLTLFTVGIGIGVLILALSVSDSFARNILGRISKNGILITVANAAWTEEGGLEPVRPGEFDENVLSVLAADVSGVRAASPLILPEWRDITAAGKAYQVRRVVGASEAYFDVMGLELTVGSRFTAGDVANGSPKVLISESAAEIMFGSADAAIGQTIQPPVRVFRTPGSEPRRTAQTFTVTGVFRDPEEVKRKAYGIGDIVLPYTAMIPGEMNRSMILRFMLNTITLQIDGSTFGQAESQIRTALAGAYGDDITLHVWEGQPNGTASILTEMRKTVSTFSLVVNILGFVLLVSGSIGILSIMIVEILAKNRDIAIERALGASKRHIVTEYFTRALLMSAGSSIIGIILSLVFSRPLSGLLIPVLNGLDIPVNESAVVTPFAVVLGVGSALVTGGIFGTLPIFSSFRAPISESIREG